MGGDKLRVLQMGTQFGVGGITRHILALRDWMRGQGHEVFLAGTPDVWASAETEPAFLDLPTRYVAGEGANMPHRLSNLGKASWRLRQWLRQNPVDLIHAHESAPALVADLARMGLNIPLAVTYHGSEPERIAAFGRIARRCDLVITPSHRSAEDLATIGGVPQDRLKVIGLGVAPAPDDPDAEVAALRAELLGDGTHLLVTIARLMYQKGVDILIDCAVELKKTNPGYRFVVAGDGPDEAALHALADEKGVTDVLTFVGRTSRPHLYLRAADIFLLTSRWEALPFTIVESFQSGTPAVASACSGVVELIDDSTGKVVPIADVPAICAGVREVLEDPARLAAMGDTALARSREDRFRPDWVHEQFEKTYRALAGKGA
ncbi:MULTISPECIES: glycosyltransferase family 4 protein [unclassified Meridianimarinicoccus]|uniref:glycosyltransferase family 4 protein n=1 Tax=unclassified Meridianimarinicoccus TaxID=2923344 RepID=UPI001865F263|nr:glycosyltransferase family 4 protein [Fluviibacterium sp. MJW13]